MKRNSKYNEQISQIDEHIVVVIELVEKSGKEGLFPMIGEIGIHSL